MATQLTDDGFEIVAFGQGYASMNWPTKKLEELVLGCRLARGGHPVLRWMAGNVSIEQDAADNWKPSKKRSPERIDGIVALVMALAMDREMDEDEMPIMYIDMPPCHEGGGNHATSPSRSAGDTGSTVWSDAPHRYQKLHVDRQQFGFQAGGPLNALNRAGF